VLQIDRVTRVVKGGRRLRFRVTVVIGDRKGRVGLGIGKSNEVVGGIQKAVKEAKKNVFKICIYNDTIPHEIYHKFKAARILLLPARAGTGLIAGGAVRKVLELAGIKNVLSKRMGTTNKINNAKATLEALREMTWRESDQKKKEEDKGKKEDEGAKEKEEKKKKPETKAKTSKKSSTEAAKVEKKVEKEKTVKKEKETKEQASTKKDEKKPKAKKEAKKEATSKKDEKKSK